MSAMSGSDALARSAAAAGPQGRPSRASAGLVSKSTTQTRVDWMKLDRKKMRLRRMVRRVDHSARVLDFGSSGFRPRKLFVTLTYKRCEDWKPSHVRHFLTVVRQWLKRRGCKLRCVWVAELQKRGAMHYHLVIWMPRHLRMPAPDRVGWWPHGSTKVERARSPINYLLKYASKADSKDGEFPRGARIHGACGLEPQHRREVRYFCAPCWVRDALTGFADIRKVVGGWCDRLTGVFVASPWRVHLPGNGDVWAFRTVEVSPC